MRTPLLMIHCLLFIFIAGCDGDKRVSLSGTITLNGEPLPYAAVKFVPVDQTAINTRAGVNTDANGKFSIPKDRGLEPGEYIVSIYATVEYDTKTKELTTAETPPERFLRKVLTPPEYNDKSAQRFTVTARGSNVYTCDVKSNVSREFGK